MDEDDYNEDSRGDRKILISPRDLHDLLNRAREYGRCEYEGFPAYLPPLGRWDRTRDGWINSKLECNHRLNGYFQCEVLGLHQYHSAQMGSPLQWVDWDDNHMTPGQPDLPAGYTRRYYEENKAAIDAKHAKWRAETSG